MLTLDDLLETRTRLEALGRGMANDPSWLGPFSQLSMDVAVGTLYGTRDGRTHGMAPDPDCSSRAESARRWIRRSARASALAFGRLAFPDQAPAIELVEGTIIGRLAQPLDPKSVKPEAWLEALFRAMTAADDVALGWLANIPESFLRELARRNGENVAEYVYSLGALLSSIAKRDGRHASLLERALLDVGDAATEPGTKASEIDEPAILALAALFADSDYTPRIIELVERHERFHAELEPIRNWISVRGIAVQRLAMARGVVALVKSTTLAPELLV